MCIRTEIYRCLQHSVCVHVCLCLHIFFIFFSLSMAISPWFNISCIRWDVCYKPNYSSREDCTKANELTKNDHCSSSASILQNSGEILKRTLNNLPSCEYEKRLMSDFFFLMFIFKKVPDTLLSFSLWIEKKLVCLDLQKLWPQGIFNRLLLCAESQIVKLPWVPKLLLLHLAWVCLNSVSIHRS